ncbi:hypothetical protein A2U01_0043055, partial [Trifolium medium]|nr:hypothetical protein [Trifolium medium]
MVQCIMVSPNPRSEASVSTIKLAMGSGIPKQ